MSTSQPLPPEPKTPSRTGGAANTTHQSVHSTPAQISAQKQIRDASGVPSSAAHATFIKNTYPNHTTWDFGVCEFVKAVFHFDYADILPKPSTGTGEEYKLSASDVKRFLATSNELKTYDPLCKVTNALLSQLYGASGPKDTKRAKGRRKAILEHWAKTPSGRKGHVRTYAGKLGTRTQEALSNHNLNEKPDLTYGLEESPKVEWEWATVAMEVERTRAMKAKGLSDILIKEDGGVFVVLDNPGIPRTTSDDEANAGGGGAKKPPAQPRDPSAGPSRQSQGPSANSGTQRVAGAGSNAGKRKLETLGSQASTESSSKRAKTSMADKSRVIINKESQILRYLNQIMSHNVRSYAIGWLIQNNKLRLVYGDRMGVVFTKSIEFLGKDADLFLLIVAAMGAAGVHDLGIHPNVHYPRIGDEPLMCRDVFDKEHGYKGATLHLDGQGEDGSGVLEYEFDVDKKAHRSVYTEFGLIGRGTTVIPVKARPGAGAASGAQASESEELVAKIAWPHAARTGEEVFIRKVRSRLKKEGKEQILQHIVDLKAWMTKDMKEMDLPRHAMGLCPGEQDVRVCRILILKCYRPLDAIGSQAEFHLVFVQVVRAHHWVYVTSKVLHCDISMNNIMWYRRGDEIIGVLCDWDLAEDQENGERRAVSIGQVDAAAPSGESKGKSLSLQQSQPLPSRPSNLQPAATPENQVKARYRTGTGPFMALDLLRNGLVPPHKYRHDLESFFYLYACAAATFDPDREQKIGVIRQWDDTELVNIGTRKRDFMSEDDHFNVVFQNVHTDFKEVVESLLRKLWHLFCEVQDIATLGQIARRREKNLFETPEQAQKRMDDIERERDAAATYEKFMQALGEPLDAP